MLPIRLICICPDKRAGMPIPLRCFCSHKTRRLNMEKLYEDIVNKLIEMAATMNDDQRKKFILAAKELLLLPEGSLSALE